MQTLHTLQAAQGSKKQKKRLGRGNASGHGTSSTRGTKGQKSRSGVGGLKRLGFRKILFATPKFKGMKPRYPKMAVVNLEDLEKNFDSGAVVMSKSLLEKNLISSNFFGIKILGNGKLTKPLTVYANSFSGSAKEGIEKAGGKAIKTHTIRK